MILIVTLFAIVIAIIVIKKLIEGIESGYGRNRKDILKANIKVEAKIISIEKTGQVSHRSRTSNPRPEVKIILEVHLTEADVYNIETKVSMLEENLIKYVAGNIVIIYLDPNDRNNLLISGLEYN